MDNDELYEIAIKPLNELAKMLNEFRKTMQVTEELSNMMQRCGMGYINTQTSITTPDNKVVWIETTKDDVWRYLLEDIATKNGWKRDDIDIYDFVEYANDIMMFTELTDDGTEIWILEVKNDRHSGN